MTHIESGLKLNVLGVGSSMRQGSYSTTALNMILDMAKGNEAETKLLDLRQTNLPMLYAAKDDTHEIGQVTELVEWADAYILATPDYHGSMSGSLKNFLDYFWSEFAGKTFGYIVASHEKGLTVMDQMRTAVRQCYGWSIPYGISINPEDDFNDKKEVINRKLWSRLDMLARDLVVYGKLIRKQFVNDLLQNAPVNTFAAYYKK
ncbi:MAG TPA: NAD(P)H-dependent oxidoreductase [Nitrososphaeraceae archaeon]|jgi:NAD(P)H-dependent FMN reductase|nr:NAD(P)H-dependent oxidoreductase [Nitrososphaeraceae archaeon]